MARPFRVVWSLVFQTFRDDFDVAYDEGTFYLLTLHPHLIGMRPRIAYLDELLRYMRALKKGARDRRWGWGAKWPHWAERCRKNAERQRREVQAMGVGPHRRVRDDDS